MQISITSYLTIAEKETLFSLESKLQIRIEQLLRMQNPTTIKIVQKVLEIIQKTPESNARERFLTNLLREPNSTSIEKVLKIAKGGIFEEFLRNIDTTKREYHSISKLMEMIDFFNETVSKKTFNITIAPNMSAVSSLALALFQSIQKCPHYYQLPKLADEYAKYLSVSNIHLTNTLRKCFNYLFEQLNLPNNNFEEYEKAEIAKIVFRLINETKTLHFSEIDLRELLNQAQLIKMNVGEEVLDYFFSAVRESPKITLDEIIRGLQLLNIACQDRRFYHSFYDWKDLSFNNLFTRLESYLVKIGLDDSHFQEDITERLNRFKNDPTVTKPLSKDELNLIGSQYQKINLFCQQNQYCSFHQLINLAHAIRKKASLAPITEDERLQLVAIGRLVIRLTFGIYPYSTQIFALLGTLIGGESRQAQVKTGEGKSTIITLWAFVMAMECRGVDIITSSRYLSKRDQQKFASFFERCGITTSHICYADKEPHHFRAQILYAPAFDFEFAWMEDQLWGAKLFEERLKVSYVARNFDAVCIDESDNLLIDTAGNGARLGYPAEISYDWIYAHILSFAKDQLNKESKEKSFKKLIPKLKDYLRDKINSENQEICKLIPDEQMEKWLASAHTALFSRKENKHYVIQESSEDGESGKRKIQIVDKETSRISENSRWSEGIHEFIEVQNDITVEKESLNPISLSHAVFYGFYKTITAFSGTVEYIQTAHIYRILTFHVPPHLPLRRKDLPPIFARDEIDHTLKIIQTTKQFIQIKRPLLILCRTIQDTINLEKIMQQNNIACELLNEVQKASEEAIVARAGVPGKVTIATPVAGRGTDIILTPESIQAGGLHVLLTFLPDSEREEQQVIGRAGRQGQPGSSQAILNRQAKAIKKKLPFNFPIQKIEASVGKEMQLLAQRLQVSYEQLIQTHLISMGFDDKMFLDQHRKEIEEIQGVFLIRRAKMERFLAEKTLSFFANFQTCFAYLEQEQFLDIQSQRLSKKGLTKVKADSLNFSHLEKNLLKRATECKRLLLTRNDEMGWKVFLKSITQDIKHQIITAWALDFFQPIEGTVRSFTESENSIKATIEEKFEQYMTKWTKYLDPKGSGVFIYLQELTTLDLRPS